jgi:ferredoxin-NADP reductase
LPDDVTSFITSADTVFLGTNFVASPSEAQTTPSLVGMNHRGGRTGFVRVRADGRTLVLPDYSGNRFMQSVGNMERTRRAALTFVDWVSGTVLLLTGDAENHYGAAAQRLMRGVPLVTTLAPTGLVFIADALRVRQRPGTTPERSPYSPPIRLLVEEEGKSLVALEDTRATLMRMRLRAPSLAEIVFRTSAPVIIAPGQAAVLDVSPLLGPRGYQHMTAAGAEARINDDGTRTWTISSAVTGAPTDEFTLTIREKPGGAATGTLFALLRAAAARQPDVLDDAMPLNMSLPLLGIAGEFVLPKRPTGLLLVAGGIGITPFLAMLRAIASASEPGEGVWDVILLVSTREPRLMDELVREAVGSSPSPYLQLAAHLFHTESLADATPAPSPGTKFVAGRITSDALHGLDITGRETFVCGPKPFEDSAIAMLSEAGVHVAAIRRENFDY